jgi:hypothetical protein
MASTAIPRYTRYALSFLQARNPSAPKCHLLLTRPLASMSDDERDAQVAEQTSAARTAHARVSALIATVDATLTLTIANPISLGVWREGALVDEISLSSEVLGYANLYTIVAFMLRSTPNPIVVADLAPVLAALNAVRGAHP